MTPELKIDLSPPPAVNRVAVPPGAKVFWILKAVYPAPYGTVWVRYWEKEYDEYLDIVTASGGLLQRVRLDPSPNQKPPLSCTAHYLEPTRRRGPLLYLRSSSWHLFYAFPDGFSGFLSENSEAISQFSTVHFTQDKRGFTALNLGTKRLHWTGVSFADRKSPSEIADISEGSAPRRLPLSPTKEAARFAAAHFDRLYFLRWVTKGEKASLEVLDKTGRPLARHALRDTFGTSPRSTFLSADWADDRRKRSPVVVVRDSDMVRVYVFSDGLRTLLAVQDFNDSSSSLSATTVSFGRDKHGLLTVTESYSERGGDDGSGGSSHESSYRWTGKSFD